MVSFEAQYFHEVKQNLMESMENLNPWNRWKVEKTSYYGSKRLACYLSELKLVSQLRLILHQ